MQKSYDLIVLGSGGAGLVAALQARELKASVLLVSKAPLGLNNCTTYAGGGFSYAGPGGDIEAHKAKTLEIGRGINDPDLLETFARLGPEAVSSLRRWGVRLDEYPSGGTVGRGTPIPGVGGLGMTMPLVLAVRDNGIDVLEQWMATDILTDDRRCRGISVVDLISGRSENIAAKAVIVATGGGGRIYSRSNNPHGTTGDGYHLLAKLGLSFRDMEFVQFYPIGLAEEKLPLWFIDLGIIDYAPLTDRSGTEFLLEQFKEWGLKSGREGNLYARDRASIAILKKWYDGDEALLHMERMTAEAWQNPYYQTLLRLNRPEHDFTKLPVRVKPLQHYMSGGVVIDKDGRTEVPGVFACGEVTGGVDGANRIGGNALTNITLFGQRAAQAAVAYATECDSVPSLETFDHHADFWSGNHHGPHPLALRRKLEETANRYLAPLREEEGLKTALAVIKELRQELPKLTLREAGDLRQALELRSLLTTADMVAEAALMRRESRGVHYRHDFPEENPDWQKPIFIKGKTD